MKKFLPISIVAIIICYFSCAKVPDTTKPTITVLSPTSNYIISQATDSLLVDFKVVDAIGVKSINVKINDSATGTLKFSDNIYPGVNSYQHKFSTKYASFPNSTYSLTIDAYDNSGNMSTDSRKYYIRP